MTQQILKFSKSFFLKGESYRLEIDFEENAVDLYQHDALIKGVYIFDQKNIFINQKTDTRISRTLDEKSGIWIFHKQNGSLKVLTAPQAAEIIFNLISDSLGIPNDTIVSDTKTIYMEFHGETEKGNPSNKFYEITLKENEIMIRYGKIGSKGTLVSHKHASKYEAEKQMQSLISSKQKRGYVEM